MRTTLITLSVLLTAAAARAELLTAMPPYPTDPKQYLNKWDPFVLQPLVGTSERFRGTTAARSPETPPGRGSF